MAILRNKLPPNMKTDIWLDFIDVIEEESQLAKDLIKEKKSFYKIESMSYDRLLELSDILGVPFDVSVDDSIEFLRSEVKSSSFRIKWKATAKLYKSFFNVIERQGLLFIYYYNGSSLVRDSTNLLANTNGMDPTKYYVHQSNENFSGFIQDQNKLDSGLKLDENWNLDNRTSKQNTKHLALEIILDKTFFGTDAGLAPSESLAPSETLAPQTLIAYLMDTRFFSYLQTNMEASKKVTEVIHIGCQLTAICDNSRYYDSLGNEYSMPGLLLNAVTTDNISGVSTSQDLYYMEFGISKHSDLPSQVLSSGVQPTALQEKIAKIKILSNEQYENSDYYGVCAQYIGNLVNDKVIGAGDDVTTTFTATLPYAPIKKGNVKIFFKSGVNTYTVEDDTYGNFIGTNADGTINYETGEVTLNTDIYYQDTLIIGTGNESQTVFSYTLPPEKRPVEPSSVSILYIISGTTYIAQDNGAGTITGTSCSGTINYTTGDINLTFSQPPANATNISMTYRFQKITIPSSGTDLVTEYYFVSGTVDITEAGITDANGNLLAYATFPRVRFENFYNHLNMNFIIKKTNF